jgi:hypothetical protein
MKGENRVSDEVVGNTKNGEVTERDRERVEAKKVW